jgi:hypothetical protein
MTSSTTNLAGFQAGFGILTIEGKKRKAAIRRPFPLPSIGIRTMSPKAPRIKEVALKSSQINGLQAKGIKKGRNSRAVRHLRS